MRIRTDHSPEPHTCPRHYSGSWGRCCAQSGSGSYPSCVPHARNACNLNAENTFSKTNLGKHGHLRFKDWQMSGLTLKGKCGMRTVTCSAQSGQYLALLCCVPVHFARLMMSACCSAGVSSRSPSACTTCSSLLWPCSRCLTTARACMPLHHMFIAAVALQQMPHHSQGLHTIAILLEHHSNMLKPASLLPLLKEVYGTGLLQQGQKQQHPPTRGTHHFNTIQA